MGRGKKRKALPTIKRERDVNNMLYNTETQELRLRLSLARFNNSKRVRGAPLGKAQRGESGEPLKYSLLACDWVPRSERAPTPAQLLARHPPSR